MTAALVRDEIRQAIATEPVRALALIETAIARCNDVRQGKAYLAAADLIATHLRKQRAAHDEQNRAAYVKLVAERRLGQLLTDMAERGDRATREQNLRRGPKSRRETSALPPQQTLAALNIDHNEAHRWCLAARVPEVVFEAWVCKAGSVGNEITRAGLLALERSLRVKPSPTWKPWEAPPPFDAAAAVREVMVAARRAVARQVHGADRRQLIDALRAFHEGIAAQLGAYIEQLEQETEERAA